MCYLGLGTQFNRRKIMNKNFLFVSCLEAWPQGSWSSRRAAKPFYCHNTQHLRKLWYIAAGLLLVKCYDNKMVKLSYNLIISPLIKPQIAKKISCQQFSTQLPTTKDEWFIIHNKTKPKPTLSIACNISFGWEHL